MIWHCFGQTWTSVLLLKACNCRVAVDGIALRESGMGLSKDARANHFPSVLHQYHRPRLEVARPQHGQRHGAILAWNNHRRCERSNLTAPLVNDQQILRRYDAGLQPDATHLTVDVPQRIDAGDWLLPR